MKNLVVIGCAKGIGRSYVLAQASEYDQMFLLDLDPNISELADQINSSTDCQCTTYQIDVQDITALQSILSELPVDSVDNLCYFIRDKVKKDLFAMEEQDWDRELNVTLKGAFFASQALAPKLAKADNPGIVFVSSICAELITPGTVSYHVSKAGLENLTKYLASHLGPQNIRCNTVRLGFIVQEEHLERFWSESNTEYRDTALKVHPLRRIGTVEDVIQGIEFLFSEKASFITGHILNIDGGLALQEQSTLAYEFSQ